jgi:hypothetical protein
MSNMDFLKYWQAQINSVPVNRLTMKSAAVGAFSGVDISRIFSVLSGGFDIRIVHEYFLLRILFQTLQPMCELRYHHDDPKRRQGDPKPARQCLQPREVNIVLLQVISGKL